MKKSEIEWMPIASIKPYDKNPRRNDDAVDAVANSITEFGFKNPIIVDNDLTIIAGHTRWKAAKKLGLKEVPVIIASDLSEDQAKAYRLVDNRTSELASWDYDLLADEIADIDLDLSDLGFFMTDDGEVDFTDLESRSGEKDDAYNEFVDKFKPKHTTDDCFTPEPVYEAVKKWVADRYHHDGVIVRPFYPGGDYKSYNYPKGCLVLDNPPFSIAAEIVRFYIEHGIDYFLFANHLTCFRLMGAGAKVVVAGCAIVYENGADINTSFVTSLGENDVEVSATLYNLLNDVQDVDNPELGSYSWPDHVISGALLGKLSKFCDISIPHVVYVLKIGDQDIYGGGGLVSDSMAEKLKAEKLKAEKLKAEKPKKAITLTAVERSIIDRLNAEG